MSSSVGAVNEVPKMGILLCDKKKVDAPPSS